MADGGVDEKDTKKEREGGESSVEKKVKTGLKAFWLVSSSENEERGGDEGAFK